MKQRLQIILPAIFFAIQFLTAGAGTYYLVTTPRIESDPGWTAGQQGTHLVVTGVAPGGPATSLRTGDEIVAINGQKAGSAAPEALSQLPAGSIYTVMFARDGKLFEAALHTVKVGAWNILVRTAEVGIACIFLVVGFAVFLLKPRDKLALLLALLFGTLTGVFDVGTLGVLPEWLYAGAFASHVLSGTCWVLFLHFFLIFPEPSPLLEKFPRLERYVYLPWLFTLFPVYAGQVLLATGLLHRSAAYGSVIEIFLRLSAFFVVLYFAGGLLSLVVNYRRASVTSRRKMRVVVAGSIAGFAPSLLLLGGLILFDLINTRPALLRWLTLVALAAVPLFPFSFAYAIVRHQVIPVRLILRRGVRYVFVSQGSVVLEMAAVFLALTTLLYSIFEYFESSNLMVVGTVSGLVAIVVWEITSMVHRRIVAPMIDRRFFRQAYNAQQVLSELGSALRMMTEMKGMSQLACGKIQQALLTENVSVFLRDESGENYNCVASTDLVENGRVHMRPVEGLVLPAGSFVGGRLREFSSALLVDFEDRKSWGWRLASEAVKGNQHYLQEYDTLREIKSALLLPIATKGTLLGIISLGPRLGDLPFSREDRQLLVTVAWQMALSIENSQLFRRMAVEERLQHELAMAAEVQGRLFPAHPPECASLDLYGICHPAQGVGGDYYDFLEISTDRIGLAVADVAGKGISAALLMSIVQASLRSQAPVLDGNLTELVSSMNRLLHKSTSQSGYATFFYAEYSQLSGRLTYVNAGHNPPILVRAGGEASGPRQLVAALEKDDDSVDYPERTITAEPTVAGRGLARISSGAVPGLSPAPESIMPSAAGIPDSSIIPLTAGGVVIGLFEDSSYQQETIQLGRGDLLIAYTDGITEAAGPDGEELGESRLRRMVARFSHLSAAELGQAIVDEVSQWCAGTPPHDDQTLVIMKVRE